MKEPPSESIQHESPTLQVSIKKGTKTISRPHQFMVFVFIPLFTRQITQPSHKISTLTIHPGGNQLFLINGALLFDHPKALKLHLQS